MSSSNKHSWLPIIFTLALFATTSWVLTTIASDEQHQTPTRWTAFIYHHGFGSANYIKKAQISDYQQCKTYAKQQSTAHTNAPWQCGEDCRFDASKQGYVCKQMRNH